MVEFPNDPSTKYRTAPTETRVHSSGEHETHSVRQTCRVDTNHHLQGRTMLDQGLDAFLGSGTRQESANL